MTTFIFNGIDLTAFLEVSRFELPALPEVNPTVREVSGRDGTAYLGSTLKPLTIVVKARLRTDTIDPAEVQRRWAVVASMLRTEEPAPLSIVPGLYRMAVLQGKSDLEFKSYSAYADLTFYCPDPVAYGRRREIEVPSSGAARFMVDGTYPASPVIRAAGAVRDSSAHLWRVRLDGGDYLAVDTGTANACQVTLDCQERTCRVSTVATLPTLASDWFSLEPGEHVIENDLGDGSCTVEYVERWL